MRKYGDTQLNGCYSESSVLTINVVWKETIEDRLEDTFQFYRSSSLVCNKFDVCTNNNHNITNVDSGIGEIELSAHQTNFRQNNNNRKFCIVSSLFGLYHATLW